MSRTLSGLMRLVVRLRKHSKTYNIPNPANLVDQVDDASKIADYGLDPETIRVEERKKSRGGRIDMTKIKFL